MPDIEQVISEARRIVSRHPQESVVSRQGRFGDYYVRVGNYRVYFSRDERTGSFIEGSERVVRFYRWTPLRRIKRLLQVFLAMGRGTLLRMLPGSVFALILFIFIAAFSVDTFGVRTHVSSLVPRFLMAFVLNVPAEKIDEAGGGWYRIDGRRITVGDKIREPLSVYYHPARWFRREPDAVKIVRQRIGSDGLYYGTSAMSVNRVDGRLVMEKDGVPLEVERHGNVFRYKHDPASADEEPESWLTSDAQRLHLLAGENVKVDDGDLIVTDMQVRPAR